MAIATITNPSTTTEPDWFWRWPPGSIMGRVIARDGLKCHWCGKMCDPKRKPTAGLFPTAEHLTKREHGGKRPMENTVVACRKCNNDRHHHRDRLPTG